MQYNDYSENTTTKFRKKNDSFVVDRTVLSYFVTDRVKSSGDAQNSSAELYGAWQEKARSLQARRWRRIKGYVG